MVENEGEDRWAREGAPAPAETLPYRIELWDVDRVDVERVVARASSASLAQAIFRAVQDEYPGRRIVQRRGARIVAQTD